MSFNFSFDKCTLLNFVKLIVYRLYSFCKEHHTENKKWAFEKVRLWFYKNHTIWNHSQRWSYPESEVQFCLKIFQPFIARLHYCGFQLLGQIGKQLQDMGLEMVWGCQIDLSLFSLWLKTFWGVNPIGLYYINQKHMIQTEDYEGYNYQFFCFWKFKNHVIMKCLQSLV